MSSRRRGLEGVAGLGVVAAGVLALVGGCRMGEGAGGGRTAGGVGMVDVREVIPGLVVELRYAGSDNLFGRPVYPADMPVLLEAGTARRLARAAEELRGKGYRLVLWDAWRPTEVALLLWEEAGADGYVVDPAAGWSRHCYGAAVDVSVADAGGRVLEMPSDFDDFSERASFLYGGDDEAVRGRLRALQGAMGRAGFRPITSEWWHFNDRAHDPKPSGRAVSARELGVVLPGGLIRADSE